MSPTQEEISIALTHYRHRVVSHNREAFTRFLRMAASAHPNSPLLPNFTGDLLAARTEFIRRLFGITRSCLHHCPSRFINSPDDVDNNWAALVRFFDLDGVYIDIYEDRRNAKRIGYREAVQTKLREYGVNIEFPDDFWTLMGMVDGLEGHGWPQYRQRTRQIQLWDGSVWPYVLDGTVVEALGLDLGDWEMKAGWRCGAGTEAACYILYCRAKESEERTFNQGTSWGWRYLVDMNHRTFIFDNVVDLLGWYELLNVPDLEHLDQYIFVD